MPEHVFMFEVEIITDGGRRRRWTVAEKLRIVEETLDERSSISVVARRNGVGANLLHRWRRLMLEGGAVAVSDDDDVTSNRVVRQMDERIRELERQLGRKTMEVEILKEALDKARQKNRCGSPCRSRRTVPGERGREGARGLPLAAPRPPGCACHAHSALPQGPGRGGGAAHHRSRRGPPDLRLPAHHCAPEPPAPGRRGRAREPQAGLPDHAGAQPAPGAPLHRAARPRPRRQGGDAPL